MGCKAGRQTCQGTTNGAAGRAGDQQVFGWLDVAGLRAPIKMVLNKSGYPWFLFFFLNNLETGGIAVLHWFVLHVFRGQVTVFEAGRRVEPIKGQRP